MVPFLMTLNNLLTYISKHIII